MPPCRWGPFRQVKKLGHEVGRVVPGAPRIQSEVACCNVVVSRARLNFAKRMECLRLLPLFCVFCPVPVWKDRSYRFRCHLARKIPTAGRVVPGPPPSVGYAAGSLIQMSGAPETPRPPSEFRRRPPGFGLEYFAFKRSVDLSNRAHGSNETT
jgi:hypothetical protein